MVLRRRLRSRMLRPRPRGLLGLVGLAAAGRCGQSGLIDTPGVGELLAGPLHREADKQSGVSDSRERLCGPSQRVLPKGYPGAACATRAPCRTCWPWFRYMGASTSAQGPG